MKAIIYGSGNIGRGFLAELLQENGYEITFVDVNSEVIQRLNNNKTYTIKYIENDKLFTVGNYQAINSKTNEDALLQAITEASLILTAVGVKTLPFLNNQLAKGLNLPANNKKTIIACENAIRASSQWKESLWPLLSAEAKTRVQILDAVVDRIVPGGNTASLDVVVEEYKNLTIDKAQDEFGFKLQNADLAMNLDVFIERKIFLVNALHCYIAWQGIEQGIKFIHEALKVKTIIDKVQKLADELVAILVAKHKLDSSELSKYAHKALQRFQNEKLNDRTARVGAGVLRKLSFNDRLITPLRYANELGIDSSELIEAIKLGLRLKNPSDPEIAKRDELLTNRLEGIKTITGLDMIDKLT